MTLSLVPWQYEYNFEHGVPFKQMSGGRCCTTVVTKDGIKFTFDQTPAGKTD